jgi:hypothetical protein
VPVVGEVTDGLDVEGLLQGSASASLMPDSADTGASTSSARVLASNALSRTLSRFAEMGIGSHPPSIVGSRPGARAGRGGPLGQRLDHDAVAQQLRRAAAALG